MRRLLRRFVFYVVAIGCGWVGDRFRCFQFPGMQMPGAVMAAVFDVVILGQRRQQSRASAHLADPAQNDFCAALIEFHRAVNFDSTSGETANIADISQIV